MQIPGFGEIAEQLRRSTVQIHAGRRGFGSGVIVRPGVIVTNAHVAAFQPLEAQFWDGTRTPAQIDLRDTARDLAVLRVGRTELPAAALADSDQLRVGELVIAIGNPLGFSGALTTGVVHAIGRVPGLGPRRWVQADVRLAPGNSGGPLADVRGRVIGINTMVAAGLGLAVPSNTVARILRLQTMGGSHAPLGVLVRAVPIGIDGEEGLGLLIQEIVPGGPAATASLMQGDIVIGVNGRTFSSLEDFEDALDGGGQSVIRVQFVRGDRTKVRNVAVCLRALGLAAA